MIAAGFTFIRATLRVFRRIQIAKILELIKCLHMTIDFWTLPMSGFELAMFGALFGNLDFFVGLCKLCIYFFLAVGADALSLGHSIPPSIASIINASGNKIIDMVTIRSYLRTLVIDEADVAK